MAAWNDFSDAEEQTSGDIIPKGTLAKVYMSIKPGGYNDPEQGWTEGMATRSERTGAVYLSAEFTVLGGKYNKRKVWSLIGLHSPKGDKWAQMGRSFIRAALESRAGIKPDDASERAMKARRIDSLADLDGIEFVAKIDVQEGTDGYNDKNVIQNVIGASHKSYKALMNEEDVPQSTGGTKPPAQASDTGTPAWMSN